MFFEIIGYIILVTLGFFIIKYPKMVLYLQDILRIDGAREYSSYAIATTRLFGGLLILIAFMGAFSLYDEVTTEYVITFNVDGDKEMYESVTVRGEKSIDLTEFKPIKEGYVFVGWTEYNYGIVAFNTPNIPVVDNDYYPTKTQELVAVFKEIE